MASAYAQGGVCPSNGWLRFGRFDESFRLPKARNRHHHPGENGHNAGAKRCGNVGVDGFDAAFGKDGNNAREQRGRKSRDKPKLHDAPPKRLTSSSHYRPKRPPAPLSEKASSLGERETW